MYTAGLSHTTCRHFECPQPKSTMQPFTFRLSLEKASKCNPGSNILGHQAIASLSAVLQSAHSPCNGKRGLGARGEEWWCLRCVEALFVEVRRRWLLAHPNSPIPTRHPFHQFANWIIADLRSIPTYPGKYTLILPYIYALEKWKAVTLYDDWKKQKQPAQFEINAPARVVVEKIFLGLDEESLYLDEATRNLRGVMQRGNIAEVPAQDCRGVALSVVFQRVDSIMAAIYKARRAARQAAEVAIAKEKSEARQVLKLLRARGKSHQACIGPVFMPL